MEIHDRLEVLWAVRAIKASECPVFYLGTEIIWPVTLGGRLHVKVGVEGFSVHLPVTKWADVVDVHGVPILLVEDENDKAHP